MELSDEDSHLALKGVLFTYLWDALQSVAGQSWVCQSRVGVQRKHPFFPPPCSWYLTGQAPSHHQEHDHSVPPGHQDPEEEFLPWE